MASEGPLLPRRRLGLQLRELRGKQTLEEVAQETLISKSKLSRLETGLSIPQPRDVRDLITFYKVDPTTADRLRKLAAAGRRQSWWSQHADGLSASQKEYLDLESSASIVRTYHQGLVPGMLQTPQYAANVLATIPPMKSSEAIELQLKIRLLRKQLFTETESGKRLIAVIDEAALVRRVGGSEIMHEQLEHLLKLSEYPSIAIHVLPFDAGAHAALMGMFTIFEFDEDDQDVVVMETHSGDRRLEEKSSMLDYLRMFNAVINKALDAGDSRTHLSRLMSRMKPS